jgi:hypothetical protein
MSATIQPTTNFSLGGRDFKSGKICSVESNIALLLVTKNLARLIEPKRCRQCSSELEFDPECGGMVCGSCERERALEEVKSRMQILIAQIPKYDPEGLHQRMPEAEYDLARRIEIEQIKADESKFQRYLGFRRGQGIE